MKELRRRSVVTDLHQDTMSTDQRQKFVTFYKHLSIINDSFENILGDEASPWEEHESYTE